MRSYLEDIPMFAREYKVEVLKKNGYNFVKATLELMQ
jgi:hypothetical protein